MAICVRNKTTSTSGAYFFLFDMNFRELAMNYHK